MVSCKRLGKINVTVVIILVLVVTAIGVSLFVARQARRGIVSQMDLNAGNAAYDKQDWPTAAKHFQGYLGGNPDDLEILKKYADSGMHLRPLDARAIGGALSAYRHIIRVDPNDEAAYEQLAKIYTYTGQFEELKYIAEKRLECNFPDEQKAQLWLANALVRLDKAEEAKTELEKLIAELEKVEDKPDEYVQACTLMSQIILSDDSDDTTLARQERAKKALEWLRKAVEGVPHSAEALVARARFCRKNSDIPGMKTEDRMAAARADLDSADKLGAEDPRIRSALCAEWIAHGEYEKADAELQAVDDLPEEVMDEHFFDVNDWTSTRFVLASELALRKAEPNEAAKLTDKVLGDLTEKRHRIRVLDPAIIAYVSADRAADANDCLDEYIDATRSAGLDAQDRLRHTFLRASVARAQNRPYAVIDILQPVLVDNVSNPRLWRLLAEAYQRTNQPSRAIEAYKQYLGLSREDSQAALEATIQLADQYARIEDWSRVFKYAQRAESIDPNDIFGRLLRIEAAVHLSNEQEEGVDTARLKRLSNELADLRQRYPERLDIRTLQSIIAVNMGRSKDAEEELKQAISRAEGRLKLTAEMQLARYYYGDERIEDAIDVCEKVCAGCPNVAEPWGFLATLQSEGGYPDSAQATLEEGLAAVVGEREKRTLSIQLAALELRQGKNARAKGIQRLTELAAQDKNDTPVRSLLLSIREVLEDPDEAQRLVDELRAAEGETGFRWRFHQASLWRASDDWRSKQSEIADALEYCIYAEPTWSAPALLLGQMYESLSDLQGAEDVYRRALAKNATAIQVANRLTGLLLAQNKLSDPDEVLDLVKASSDDIDSLELKMALGSGDLDLAIRKLKDRMSDGDNNASEVILLARLVYEKDRNLGEAQEHLEAAEAVDPNSTALVAAKVAIYRADGKDQEARKVLDDYVTKMGDFNAYLLRAKYLAGEGELEDAEKDYKKLTSFAGRNAVGYTLLSDFYIANQDYNKAMEALENGLDANPQDLNLQRALMNALFRWDSEEDRERALDILGKLEAKLPRDIELMRIRASLLLAESTPGSIEKAKEKLERIIELEPRAVDAHLRLIDMAMKRGDLEDARHLMIQALGSNSNNSMLLSVRSKIELMAGDKQRAVELARLAIPDLEAHCQSKDGSSNIDTILLLAQMYRISGDLNAAKRWIEQAEQLDPDSPTVIDEYTTLASTFYQKSDAERAKQIYQDLCDQYADNYPQNLRIFNDLAWILQGGDSDYVRALDLANKGLNAARQDSEKLHLFDTRGTILFKMGRFTAAKKDFEALVSISPPDSRRMAKALLHLGRTCSKLNQLDQAKKHLAKALEIDQNLDVFIPEERSEIDRLMK